MVKEEFVSHGKPIPVELFQPAEGGKHPAIIVAHGTAGMNEPFGSDIRSFASDLAGKGYVVLIPHYLARTGTSSDDTLLAAFVESRDAWVETLGDALSYGAGRGDVEANRFGLLGFSMGGHLSLRAAKVGTGVKVGAVVEFFAPITQPPFNDLGGDLDRLPPIQVHHGDDDRTVLPQQSRELERLLVKAGKRVGSDYELHFYPHEGHGFQGADAVAASKRRTREFFDQHVK